MIARVFHCHTRGFIFIVVFEISVLICQVDTIGNKMLALVYHWVTICGFSSVSARWLYRDTFLCFRTVTTIACEKYLCIWWTRTHGWSSCWNGIPPAMECPTQLSLSAYLLSKAYPVVSWLLSKPLYQHGSVMTPFKLLLFIHSGYFYSASSSALLLRGTPDYSIDTASELTRRSTIGNC